MRPSLRQCPHLKIKIWGPVDQKRANKDEIQGSFPFDKLRVRMTDSKNGIELIHLGFALGFEVFGVLDGADFDVGLFAGFIAAEAGDPDLAVANHGSLGVDEEVFVFLFEDGVLNVLGDDAVVVLDEGLLIFDGEGFFARVDLDGVVDKVSDGGRVVFGDGLLKLGEELLDLDVISDGEINGFVESGGGGLSGAEGRLEE